jgi:hypothetical protein
MVKNITSDNTRDDSIITTEKTRKLKNSVPLPEAEHIKIAKILKK